MSEIKTKLVVDIDKVISAYNQKNPDKKQLTRTIIAEHGGFSTQQISNWSRGLHIPKSFNFLKDLCVFSGLNLNEIIIEKESK